MKSTVGPASNGLVAFPIIMEHVDAVTNAPTGLLVLFTTSDRGVRLANPSNFASVSIGGVESWAPACAPQWRPFRGSVTLEN